LAPDRQNHLLRTSSVVSSIKYGPKQIQYSKFDKSSTELFKLDAGKVKSVTGGRTKWNASSKTLLVQAQSDSVTITLE
jgi:hypothetical protein